MSVIERILVDKITVDSLEQDILQRRHIERYCVVRQYLYGTVIDCACGVGYGTYLLSKNPDITNIYGIDCDAEAISHAKQQFTQTNVNFLQENIETFTLPEVDVLVSLETIEHLKNPRVLADFARRCDVKEIVLSYPAKKTTHYNPYHLWDFRLQDIQDIFSPNYVIANSFVYTYDTQFVHLIRIDRHGAPAIHYQRSS